MAPRRIIADAQRLPGYWGVASAIWEYRVKTRADAEYCARAVIQLKASAIIRSGLGVWLAIADGRPLHALYQDRDAARAAVEAVRSVERTA